ncbi:MAG: hypothetical protein ACI9TF_000673 [Paracrocinitomix sp.]|jgi:hypothetical protein|tara:strand:- start:11 stop:142 length:132 start_codon:yes stop_codon:yes gene_type:complete
MMFGAFHTEPYVELLTMLDRSQLLAYANSLTAKRFRTRVAIPA